MQLKINDRIYQADRQAAEARLLSLLLSKKSNALKEMGPSASMMTTAVKGAIVMILRQMGLNPPQKVDTLDYSVGLLVHTVFDALEKEPIELTLEDVIVDAGSEH